MKKILIIVLIALGMACRSEDKRMNSNTNAIVNCAHRGASGHAPENTLAAIRVAMDMGAQMSEIDVQQTADDRLVLLHDAELERTTNGTGYLWQKNLADLKGLDAGSWYDSRFAGEPLPTLEEAMALVRTKIKLNIEVKLYGHGRNLARFVVDTIRRENFERECLITSFGHEFADEVKKLAPELQVAYIFGTNEYHESVFTGAADLLSVHHRLIGREFIAKARIEVCAKSKPPVIPQYTACHPEDTI